MKRQGREVRSQKVLAIPCEVYSRVVGYFRPVQNWNPGKQQEFNERRSIKLESFWKIKHLGK